MDGTFWTLDLIPSVVLDKPIGKAAPTPNPVDAQFNRMLEGARPIVEADKVLRVEFNSVQACVVQEEFVDLFDALQIDLQSLPLLEHGKGCFPFVLVEGSEWRASLPDYQGGDCDELKHFMLFSMETHLSLLGIMESYEWVMNAEAS